jgi:hypothetical protein
MRAVSHDLIIRFVAFEQDQDGDRVETLVQGAAKSNP